MAMVWAVDEEAVRRVDNPIFESEFRENRLFNLGAEHTTRTAPVQWTQSCQPRPDPSVESEDTCAILGAPIGGPEIERQADVAAVESNRTVKADVQEKGGAISGGSILGVPIGVPKIEQQADIAAVESNRAVKADVQKKGGDISF